MALVFYQKYYPPEKTNRLRSQITSFKQSDDEALFEAWERYKRLIRECPHHGLNNWLIIMQFYNGLREENRAILDSAANGRFANNTDEDKAWGLIEEMVVHSQQYSRQKGSSSKIHDTDSISVLTSHIAALTQQIGKLQGPSLSVNAIGGPSEVTCGACGVLGHTSMECRANTYEVNAFQSGNYNSNVYTENSRNHPNFSWRSNNVLNPPVQQFQQPQQSQQVTYLKPYVPPGFQKQNSQQPPPPAQSNLEAMMSAQQAMMQQMLNMQATHSAEITRLGTQNKMFENQLAQMATSSSTRQPGSLPSKSQQPHETLNAITLRSGAQYDGPERPKDDLVEGLNEDTEGGTFGDDIVDVEDASDDEVQAKADRPGTWTDRLNETNDKRSSKDDRLLDEPIGQSPAPKGNFPIFQPKAMGAKKDAEIKLPFPSRQQNKKTESQYAKFLEVINGLQVSIPFMDLILQVPSYAKFVKDILSRKRNLSGNETAALTEECNFIMQGQSPPKLRDPGSFSIPCTIGPLEINSALCDLGASISIMPYTLYERLNAGSLKHTPARIQLADRSVKYPIGILEDMPVKVGKFFIPVDFMVLDIAEDHRIPIILGRPFLNTARAVIDVKRGRMTLEVGDEIITFNLSETPTKPRIRDLDGYANFMEDAIAYRSLQGDPLDNLVYADSCAAMIESRPAEKPPSEPSSVWGRGDPRRGTDPRWKSVCDMIDTDFDNCGEMPADFVGAVYGSAMKRLFDAPGKGADGEP